MCQASDFTWHVVTPSSVLMSMDFSFWLISSGQTDRKLNFSSMLALLFMKLEWLLSFSIAESTHSIWSSKPKEKNNFRKIIIEDFAHCFVVNDCIVAYSDNYIVAILVCLFVIKGESVFQNVLLFLVHLWENIFKGLLAQVYY